MVAAQDRLITLPDGVPERTLGFEALAWAAKYLRHPDGPRAGQRWQFTHEQARFILWFYEVDENGDWVWGHAARRLSKGPIAHSEMVPTPQGWKRHGDLKVWDEVYAVDGSVTRVLELGDEVNEDCYDVVFRDGTSVRCTGSHRWPVETFVGGKKRKREIVTVKEMIERGLVFERPLTSGKTKATSGDVKRFKTLPSPRVEGVEADLPIDPYVFGYWLGDGDSDGARITCGDEDLPYLVSELNKTDHPHYEPNRTNTAWRVGVSNMKRQLRELGVLNNKHIPDMYLKASVEQRFALLQGLMDSDGTVSASGSCEISMMQGPMRGQILELARSLGLMPTVTDSTATLRGRIVGERFRIRFTPMPDEQVCRLPRKLERCKKERKHAVPFGRSRTIVDIRPVESEPARCITVSHDDHQYLVGEGWVPTCNSGKSPFAAVMAVIELLAPVRFDGFDSSVMGGCVGRPEAMPWVQIAAASADQTRNTMSVVRALLAKPNAPQLHEDYDLDLGKEKIYSGGVGVLEIITSSAASAEGSRATFIVADEVEHWLPSNGGVELDGTLKANLTKTGNRMLETLNAWKPGLDSAGERTFNSWCEQEDGRARETKRKILYDSRMAPPDTDIGDEDSLREALEFVYADCPWSLRVLDAIIADFYTSSTSLDASKRKYLNWPTASVDAWCDPQKWAAMAKPDRVVEPGEDIGMFFDGSLSRDDTALIGVCLSDGHVFTIGMWSPGNSHDKAKQARINPESVDAKVKWAKATYNVRGFFADVREWEGYVKVHWPELFRDSLDIWARPRGDLPEPIAWDMRVFKRAFAQAAELTEAEIDQGTFTHDGDPMLSRHVRNAHRYDTQWGISVKKESPNSSLKIDGCVAMIGARHVYRLLKEAGTGKREMTYEAFFV